MKTARATLERTGRQVLDAVDAGRDLRRTLVRTTAAALRGRRPEGAILQQLYQVGNRSLLFVAVTLGFLGMVLVFQTCLQVNRVTGDLSQIGAEFLKILLPSLGKLSGSKPRRAAAAPPTEDRMPKRRNLNRISGYEMVCYTLALALAAAVASGWFDLMIPWSA